MEDLFQVTKLYILFVGIAENKLLLHLILVEVLCLQVLMHHKFQAQLVVVNVLIQIQGIMYGNN